MEEPETTSTGNNKKANVDGPAVDGVSHAASNGVLHVVEAKTEPEVRFNMLNGTLQGLSN